MVEFLIFAYLAVGLVVSVGFCFVVGSDGDAVSMSDVVGVFALWPQVFSTMAGRAVFLRRHARGDADGGLAR